MMATPGLVRIILVEDNAPLRELTREVLEASGRFHVVAVAGDGDEALEVCRRHDYDVVLLDLRMPRRSGLDVLPELRAIRPQAAIIVYSMMPRETVEPLVKGLGAIAFLEKSSDSASFLRDLSAIVDRHLAVARR